MSQQKLPVGWTPEKIREVIDHHENQTGKEAVAELESAFTEGRGYRTMHIPIEVENQVLQIIDAAEDARRSLKESQTPVIAESRKPYRH